MLFLLFIPVTLRLVTCSVALPQKALFKSSHSNLSNGAEDQLSYLTRSKAELLAENALLRQQLIILHRQVKQPVCRKTDRLLLVLLARMVRTWKQALFLVQPETLLRWNRELFRLFWKHKSSARSSKPKLLPETISLIKEMVASNRLWDAEWANAQISDPG